METRLPKKEKDLSIALMPQKTLRSCYLCYQQGMQYLHNYFGSLLAKFHINCIYQRNQKITEELKVKETCIVREIKCASSGPADSCVASMSAQMVKVVTLVTLVWVLTT